MILENDCDINYTEADGNTPLHRSCRYSDDVNTVEALLARKADINAREGLGYTPLMVATFNKHSRVAEYLIKQGAIIDAQAKNGECALYHAIMTGDYDTVRCLLEQNAEYQLRTSANEIFLHYAARRTGDRSLISLLHSFNLVDTKTVHVGRSHGSTALQLATSSDDAEWLRMFAKLVHKFAQTASAANTIAQGVARSF